MFMLAALILICPAIVAFALAFAVCWKWQRKFTSLQEKMDRIRGKTRAAGGLWAYRWSNRAFDEYRAEMATGQHHERDTQGVGGNLQSPADWRPLSSTLATALTGSQAARRPDLPLPNGRRAWAARHETGRCSCVRT